MLSKKVESNVKKTESERVIFPRNKKELIIWTHQNDILNSYDELNIETIGKKVHHTIRDLLIDLLKNGGIPESDNHKKMIQEISQSIKFIETSNLSNIMKGEIIKALMITNDGWANKPNHIKYKNIHIEEKIKGEQVNIISYDGLGFSPTRYFSYKNRPSLAGKIITSKTSDPVEKKIIEMIIDRKPYIRNHFLSWPHEQGLRSCQLKFNWEQKTLEFIDKEYNGPPELYIPGIPFLQKQNFKEKYKGKSKKELKELLLNEKWFTEFIPDYKKDNPIYI